MWRLVWRYILSWGSHLFSDIKILWLIHCRMCEIMSHAKCLLKNLNRQCFLILSHSYFPQNKKMSSTHNEKYLLPTRKWLTHTCFALRMFIQNLCQNQIWTCRGQFSADSGVLGLYFRHRNGIGPLLLRVTDSRRSIKTVWVDQVESEDLEWVKNTSELSRGGL